jgi:hypothetical protein
MHKLLDVPLETWERRGAERQDSNGAELRVRSMVEGYYVIFEDLEEGV